MQESHETASPKKEKLFVLDTSVILYDHQAIINFQEHDIAIPIHVLEELDNFKSGNQNINFEAREFIRFIDKISKKHLINDWIPLNGSTRGKFRIVMNDQSDHEHYDALSVFGDNKMDHKILNTALAMQTQFKGKKIILVSKDICLRLKAKALNLHAEDYETGKIKDVSSLYTGKTVMTNPPGELISELVSKGSFDYADLKIEQLPDNHFFIFKLDGKSIPAIYNATTQKIELIEKRSVFNIVARNIEQNFAIHVLMNPNIKLVSMQGMAGTGKTLLALASALEQRRHYRQIFISCPIIPLSNKDLGFLPGDIKSKMDPYMQPFWDNMTYIKSLFNDDDKQQVKLDEMIKNEKIAIAPLAYIRGRSLTKVFFIVDEAQNLTPHEVKTIISRAGDDTKIVFMGDIHQIDTPYLDSQSNGLSYLIDRVKSNPLFAHITLEKGERSELANLANKFL